MCMLQIVYKQPRCAENAVPTVFPGCPEHILKALKRRRETLQKDSILKAERVKVSTWLPPIYEQETLLTSQNSVPDTWSRIVRVDGPKAVFYTQAVSKKIKEQIVPLFVKQVCVNENANFTFSEMGKTVSNQHLSISPEPLTSCQELREILLMFNSVKLCCGTKLDKKLSDWECVCLWLDLSGCYRHHNCSLVVSEDSVCKEYKKIQRTIR
ncbi:hypothetical protein PR048_009089 [Dryococelus australis]|uniref:Uncharacterized protein n=1 Tax=Dryococelus australis TaxID=614101 RepID=A0ABQ9HYX8_9NEOP|nr:hypothetical protein PR048_009089 [Dryococelus australis]